MTRKTKQIAHCAFAYWRPAMGLAAGILLWIAAKYFGAPQGTHLLLA